MTIRKRLLIWVLLSVTVIFTAVWWLSYSHTKKMLVSQIHGRAEDLIQEYSLKLDTDIKDIEDMARSTATAMESLNPENEEEIKTFIQEMLGGEPKAYGSAIAFEPGSFKQGTRLFAPYYHRSKDGLTFVDLAAPTYDYQKWDWYRIPRDEKKPMWGEPYIDTGGGEVAMMTYSHPFFINGEFKGVATGDIALSELTASVDKLKVGKSGFAFVISRKGVFLTMRDKDWSLKKTIFDMARQRADSEMMALGEHMTAGEAGYTAFTDPDSGMKMWVSYKPIVATGWSIGIVMPEEELLAELTSLHNYMFAMAAAGLAVISIIIFIISSHISRPIRQLALSARKIADGDFTVKPEGSTGRDEIGVLTRAFADMQKSLASTLENLREGKAVLEAGFTNMSDGLVILNSRWEALQHNRVAERLLMLPSNGPLIRHIMTIFESSVPYDRITDPDRGSQTFKLSRRETDQLGPLHLAGVSTPILDEKGIPSQIVLTLRDVTSEVIEESSKSNFLSLVSHKLRTPLSVLKSTLAMMRDGLAGPLSEKQQRQADTMAKQVTKLDGLVEKLIGFVTLEGSGMDTTRENLELASLVEEIAAEARDQYQDKHPEISVGVAPDVMEISFNKGYMRLVIWQLVENALKFNLNDPAHVAVDCRRDADRLVINVDDDGVGIPPEYLDKIFDRLFQVEKYFTGNVEGMGLGLTYTRQIVEFFGGSIKVSSTPGKGSTFTVNLPLMPVEQGLSPA